MEGGILVLVALSACIQEARGLGGYEPDLEECALTGMVTLLERGILYLSGTMSLAEKWLSKQVGFRWWVGVGTVCSDSERRETQARRSTPLPPIRKLVEIRKVIAGRHNRASNN